MVRRASTIHRFASTNSRFIENFSFLASEGATDSFLLGTCRVGTWTFSVASKNPGLADHNLR